MEKGAARESPVNGDHQARNAEEERTMTSRVKTEDDGGTEEVCGPSRVVGCCYWGEMWWALHVSHAWQFMSWICCQLLHNACCQISASSNTFVRAHTCLFLQGDVRM